MGTSYKRKLIALCAIFLIVTTIIYYDPKKPEHPVKQKSLNQALEFIEGWQAGAHIPYDMKIVQNLALDDYVNKTFVRDNNVISLYIGYYLTAKKVGAAHDPLVCFPGQGWKVSDKNEGSFDLNGPMNGKINYSSMIVDRGVENKNLILYWFQAYETNYSNTLSQKIAIFMQKVKGKREDNAFVRVTCAINGNAKSECMDTIKNFIEDFYPVFVNYIVK